MNLVSIPKFNAVYNCGLEFSSKYFILARYYNLLHAKCHIERLHCTWNCTRQLFRICCACTYFFFLEIFLSLNKSQMREEMSMASAMLSVYPCDSKYSCLFFLFPLFCHSNQTSIHYLEECFFFFLFFPFFSQLVFRGLLGLGARHSFVM